MNLPNAISFLRLCSVPVFIWLLLRHDVELAFWLFTAAAVTDAIDGFIAKKLNQRTTLGAFLDPLADKALLVSAFFILGMQDVLPMWLVLLVIFRDLVIVGGAVVFETVTKSLQMEPLLISKINTLVQILMVAGVLADLLFAVPGDHIVTLLEYVVAGTTVISGMAYMIIWSSRAQQHERGNESKRD